MKALSRTVHRRLRCYAESQSSTYSQSVASGDPNPNGVVLRTRVDSQAQATNGSATIAWQIAADSGFAAVVIGGVAILTANSDDTVKLPIQNAALQPFTTYYYRFIYNGIVSPTGRLKTLPAPGFNLAELRLGYVVCQDYGNGYYNALRYLATRRGPEFGRPYGRLVHIPGWLSQN